MDLKRKNWTKKFLVRLPKDAKAKNDADEKKLIKTAFDSSRLLG